jgi:adenylate cyclase
MLTTLDELNKKFQAKGWPEIRIGIGINSGMMSVGNMGSTFRRAYTVLGDAVNLGSRLEGITKVYGVDFLVSETTAHHASLYCYRELDRVRVKGKTKPVTILEPIDLDEDIDNETRDNIRAFDHFLVLYRNQDWEAALKALRLMRQHQGDCLLFQLYEERIEQLQDTPPGEDWDGVFVHTSK